VWQFKHEGSLAHLHSHDLPAFWQTPGIGGVLACFRLSYLTEPMKNGSVNGITLTGDGGGLLV
ncbi:MAG TPA: hypothetical protein VKK81_24775, partial [Candidatus Binatia bacterium]|nr:hypothetical protein [Candidatus Binatia bacterium]